MKYIGDGDWKCSTCGSVVAFEEPNEEDDDNGEALSVWDAADIFYHEVLMGIIDLATHMRI